MDVVSDPVALELAGDRAGPVTAPPPVVGIQHPVVELCGYVVAKQRWQLQFEAAPDPPDGPAPPPGTVVPSLDPQGHALGMGVDEVHLFTTKSFDQWLEIPKDSVRAQRPNLPDYSGRSQIWVDADVEVKHCRKTTAADVAQSLSSGMDDPTALPGKKTTG